MPSATLSDSRRKQWLAAAAAAAVVSAALAVWFYASLPSPDIQASPLQPWFLVEGANASWDVRDRADGVWRNETGTMAVLNVSQDHILFRVKVDGSYLDHPLPIGEVFDFYTTLGAALKALDSVGVQVVDYTATLGVVEAAVGPVATLSETATYIDEYGARTTSHRVVELPNLLLISDEVLIVSELPGSTFEFYSMRNLLRVEGIDLLPIESAATTSLNLMGEDTNFVLFNGDLLEGRTEGGGLALDLESRSPSILASMARRDLFVSLVGLRLNISDLTWPLNDTHALTGLKIGPGRHRLVFGLAESVSEAGTPAAVFSRRGDGPHHPGGLRNRRLFLTFS